MDNGITLPPMEVVNEDSFMRTFVKNYARIKDPQAKLRFYTWAMENMKAKWMKPRDFYKAFSAHSENPDKDPNPNGHWNFAPAKLNPVVVKQPSKGWAVRW